MNRHFSLKFNKDLVIIGPGERYATAEEVIISTVLGSCIAITLFEPELKIGGMNHYMLPGEDTNNFSMGITGKYGVHAMDLLLQEMQKLGCRKEKLEAKVFGGGAVLLLQGEGGNKVPKSNIEFAYRVLKTKYQIPVAAGDTGGINGRKIFFDPKTGKVTVKTLGKGGLPPVAAEEAKIIQELRKGKI